MAITALPSASIQPASFLRPCLLLLLDEQPGHGYEVRDRLVQLVAVVIDTAVVYRALNAMEDDGLVSSRWERSTEGPQRRCYAITADGRRALGGWARQLNDLDLMVGGLLERLEARAC
jgi:DNA-binding PadR family transcriptional regulator